MIEILLSLSFYKLLNDVSRMCLGKTKESCRPQITELIADRIFELSFNPIPQPINKFITRDDIDSWMKPTYIIKNKYITRDDIDSWMKPTWIFPVVDNKYVTRDDIDDWMRPKIIQK